MEPALTRNQNCSVGSLPNLPPAAADRRRLPMTSPRRRVAHPVFGTETVALATDLSPKAHAFSSIFRCGGDLRPVHPTLQRLRGCAFSSRELALLAQPDIEAMMIAWKNSVTRTTTLAASPLRQLRFASYRRAGHRLLLSLVHRPAAARVAQSGSRRPSSHGARDLTFANSGFRRSPRPSATTTVLCE
jgi:hypothetical protein